MRKKSAQQKAIEGRGSHIGVHAVDKILAAEPKCESGLLPVPSHLRGDSKRIYAFFAEQLSISGLDKRPDTHALALASKALATVWQADRRLQHDGIVVKVPIMAGLGRLRKVAGYRQQKNKWWAIRCEAAKEFDRFAGPFGLVGPSSRATLQAEPGAHGRKSLMELLMQPRKPRVPNPEEVEWQAKQAREAQEAKPKEPPPEPVQ